MEQNEENKEQDFKMKQIPMDGTGLKCFEANGKTYYMEDELSIDRYITMQGFTIQLGFGVTYEEMQKNWLKQYEYLNAMDFMNASVSAYNMVQGISKIYSNEPMILKYCALYFNTREEDRGTITEEQISAKINDWKKEGLGIDGFFVFSLLKVKGLAENYQSSIQTVSNLMAEPILKTQTGM